MAYLQYCWEDCLIHEKNVLRILRIAKGWDIYVTRWLSNSMQV